MTDQYSPGFPTLHATSSSSPTHARFGPNQRGKCRNRLARALHRLEEELQSSINGPSEIQSDLLHNGRTLISERQTTNDLGRQRQSLLVDLSKGTEKDLGLVKEVGSDRATKRKLKSELSTILRGMERGYHVIGASSARPRGVSNRTILSGWPKTGRDPWTDVDWGARSQLMSTAVSDQRTINRCLEQDIAFLHLLKESGVSIPDGSTRGPSSSADHSSGSLSAGPEPLSDPVSGGESEKWTQGDIAARSSEIYDGEGGEATSKDASNVAITDPMSKDQTATRTGSDQMTRTFTSSATQSDSQARRIDGQPVDDLFL